jgi:Tfp pilus assembly protein PilF
MSLILDALKRKRPVTLEVGADDRARAEGRSDSVLSTLGQRTPHRSRLSVRMLLLYGAAAMAFGFVGLSLLILFFAPPERPQPASAAPSAAARGTRAPAPGVRQEPTIPEPPAIAPNLTVTPTPGSVGRASKVPPPPGEPPRATASPVVPQQTASAASPIARSTIVPQARLTRPTRETSAPPPTAPVVPKPAPPRSEPVPNPASAAAEPNHFTLGLYYQRLADYDNALTQYRALLEQNDASAEGHNNLGLLYLDRGQPDDAVRQFQRAIVIDPRHVTAHNNLGVAFMRLNRPDSAASEFRVVLTMQPRNVESIVNLALVQKGAGRTADARDLLLRAVTIDPRNPGAHYNLAVLADEGGESAVAIEHYRAFLKYGSVSHSDLVARVRTRLAALAG